MTTYRDLHARLAWQDARIHRCPYDGTWLLGSMPCGTCRIALDTRTEEAA